MLTRAELDVSGLGRGLSSSGHSLGGSALLNIDNYQTSGNSHEIDKVDVIQGNIIASINFPC